MNWYHDYPQWLKLPMYQMNFNGPKDVRATEVPLYWHFSAEKKKTKQKCFIYA